MLLWLFSVRENYGYCKHCTICRPQLRPKIFLNTFIVEENYIILSRPVGENLAKNAVIYISVVLLSVLYFDADAMVAPRSVRYSLWALCVSRLLSRVPSGA